MMFVLAKYTPVCVYFEMIKPPVWFFRSSCSLSESGVLFGADPTFADLTAALCSQVLCEAVYFAACVRRLRPEDSDVLVDFPREERVVQRVARVRPPQGFALSQARHQACKVHMLHTMLKVGGKQRHSNLRFVDLTEMIVPVFCFFVFCRIFWFTCFSCWSSCF